MHSKDHKYNPHHINKALLEKYYNRSCTADEKAIVEEWFADIHNGREIKELTREIWEETPSTSEEKEILDDLLFKIYDRIITENQQKEKSKISWGWAVSAAIAVGIVFLIAGVWLGSTYLPSKKQIYAKLYAPYGSRIRFELPDGSRGWLNSGSSLKYPVNFTGNTRKVYLKGEGYFDVKHDPDKPFVVQTKNTRVTALGTSFNVHSYSGNSNNEVTLIKGVVVVDKKLQDGTFKKVSVMKPGQHVTLNAQTGRLITSNKDPEKYVAWKDGMLMFRNDPLSRVINEMEMFYNVDIEVADQSLYKYHFHATFEDETLFETLRLLKISSGIDYKICKRKKNKDGSFKKRKIILYENKS